MEPGLETLKGKRGHPSEVTSFMGLKEILFVPVNHFQVWYFYPSDRVSPEVNCVGV